MEAHIFGRLYVWVYFEKQEKGKKDSLISHFPFETNLPERFPFHVVKLRHSVIHFFKIAATLLLF